MQPNHFFSLSQIIDRQPLTVTPDTLIAEAIDLMQKRGSSCSVDSSDSVGNSSCVLVVKNRQLKGIFTERDLVRLIAFGNPAVKAAESSKMIAADTELAGVAISEVMSRDVVTLTYTGTEDIFAALNLLRSHSIRHLPIVDRDNNLLGLTTVKDLRRKLQPVNMMKWRKVDEIMNTGVVYADPEDSIQHVARLMAEHQVSCVAIGKIIAATDSVNPLGIITERDIVQFQNLNLDLGQPARDVMSAPLFLVSPEDSLWSVHQQMQQHRVRRLLVCGKQRELIGIVTQTSLLRVFDPGEMYGVIESLQQQVCQLESARTQLLENRQEELEREVAERTSVLRTVNQQGRAIAEFGQYVLATTNLPLILQRSVYLVADTLAVEYCKVLKLLPDDTLLLEVGVGWQNGLVGTAIIETEKKSQAGYTLQQSQPIVVEDLHTETRFSGSSLLIDHQVVSGISVVIADGDNPYGVLEAHTTEHRLFTQDEVNFLQAIANIIAQAIERHQAEFHLKQSEQKFRAIFDKSVQFIGLLEPNGNLIEANKTALDFIGLSAADVRGKPFWLTPWWSMSTKIQAQIKQAIAKAATGEFIRFEVEHPGTEDRVMTVDFSLTPIKDETGKVVLLIPEGRNISDRKQAEAKIQEQAALLNIATDAIMVRALDNTILFWNRGAEVLYGWETAEILNRNCDRFFNRTSTSKLSEIQQSVAETGEWQGELRQVIKSGREIIVESRWTLVKNQTGAPSSYLIVNTDITEQKQLETQFLRTQRLESLGTLAGGIAHDLNNILAPILGFAKLLPLKLPDVDEQTKGFFKIIETNAQRGTALVKQILTFSRGLEGDKGIVQIRHLINEIGQIITETFPKAIELSIDAPKTLWTVNADINQIHQVLMNLCVNARDAMPDGGKLSIQAENFTIDSEYARLHLDAEVGFYVKITITDTGVGIPPENVDRIFEPFFTTKEIGQGTGLGLSTVIGITKSHGGFIEVASDRRNNHGTQFQVFLPASDIAESSTKETKDNFQGNGELILVVDDETAILEVTKATLETYNYRVITAGNGIEAVATYVNNKDAISLVIIDIMMPRMDGKTAIRTLKQIDPDAKIIAVSGLITSQEIIKELDAEVIAFLSKPYNNEDLLETVYEIVNGS